MTIYIPLWVIYLVVGSLVWWIVGWLFNSLVWQKYRDYRMKRTYRRTGIYPAVPQWYLNWMYVFAGPVGLVAWLIDTYSSWKTKRWKRESEA